MASIKRLCARSADTELRSVNGLAYDQILGPKKHRVVTEFRHLAGNTSMLIQLRIIQIEGWGEHARNSFLYPP